MWALPCAMPNSTVVMYVYTLLCDWCKLAASDRMSHGSSRFMLCDRLWTDARLATMAGDGLGIVEHGVIAADGGAIFYAGPAADAPAFAADKVTRCDGRWITPGLIDCHTHQIGRAHV